MHINPLYILHYVTILHIDYCILNDMHINPPYILHYVTILHIGYCILLQSCNNHLQYVILLRSSGPTRMGPDRARRRPRHHKVQGPPRRLLSACRDAKLP